MRQSISSGCGGMKLLASQWLQRRDGMEGERDGGGKKEGERGGEVQVFDNIFSTRFYILVILLPPSSSSTG